MTKQRWEPQSYERHARFVSDLGATVLELLDPRPGERILDLGCGDGALTLRIAAAGADVVGLDAAPEFVAAARARGLDAVLGSGEQLAFAGEFDAVFSNAALHWMRDPDAVLAGVHRALRPGGRFVAECGGHGNAAAVATALVAVLRARGVDGSALWPWTFPTADAYRARLERHGFRVAEIGLHPRPTVLPTDLAGWLQTFAQPFLGALPARERERAVTDVVDLTRPSLCDERERWTVDYVRLRFSAQRAPTTD